MHCSFCVLTLRGCLTVDTHVCMCDGQLQQLQLPLLLVNSDIFCARVCACVMLCDVCCFSLWRNGVLSIPLCLLPSHKY